MSTQPVIPSFTAHNGFALPAIGLGTYALNGDAGATAVAGAIGAGYRLVDSAFNYENEGSVGRGVAQSEVARDEIIVTTKLPGRHHPSEKARTSIEESRSRLGLDVTDLHLIHWPNPSQDEYVQAWAALVDAQARGVVRQIGVSNFLPEHLERIEKETGVRPVVNQIEVHPFFPQEEQIAYHREQGILTEAWSPLGRARALLEEQVILDVAAAHEITPAQTVLAWHVARGTVSIPKASSLEHQLSNLAAAEVVLDEAEVAAITALGRPDGRLFGADPRTHEES
ncbi:aldo/keto reductase [Microbacterium saperdae]|uniref:Diketogulonate reductase-like aldo/keto reductase n=1 Tax=Microbacterium saperdae TaxID=69368 RepID=A0A543BMC8_9MICO|nr:aldo/keto reductase [Microbacterium saperdae]TQL85974.1 diketogulonate reductase-like aldo/keto reductase [Microbacterium saperdae]GGM51582.1 2,5-diketo-D-gluconic acid reductase [Microbacterium saperdae]